MLIRLFLGSPGLLGGDRWVTTTCCRTVFIAGIGIFTLGVGRLRACA